MRRGAEEYATRVMANLEEYATRILEAVRKAREGLTARPSESGEEKQ